MGKSEETRAFIIERTAGLFNRKGYAGTSLNDITAATSLTKGSVYGNFANKDEVALAVFDHNWKRVVTILRSEIADGVTAREKLLACASAYLDYEKFPFPEGGCPLLNTATEADDTHPGLRQKTILALENWKTTIVRIIEQGIREGEFTQTTDPEQLALTVIAMIEGSVLLSKTSGKPSYRVKVMKMLQKLINELD